MLKKGDKVALVACSNGQSPAHKNRIENLVNTLNSLGLDVILSKNIYSKYSVFNGSAKEKASSFMELYKDPVIKALFDISGGDIANEILDYLDYSYIAQNPKPVFGYSDLTTVLNSLYSQSNIKTYLYQVRNLLYTDTENQTKSFCNSLFDSKADLFDFPYHFIQGNYIDGIVVGGNIRCLLKLAGTKYMPNFSNKILFLESLGGEVAVMSSFLNQLKQIGAFENIKGLILGTFTQMEESNISPSIENLVLKIVDDPNLPIVKTTAIGHGHDSKCIIIGENIILNKK